MVIEGTRKKSSSNGTRRVGEGGNGVLHQGVLMKVDVAAGLLLWQARSLR